MTPARRRFAAATLSALMFGLLVAAWYRYRSASLLLLLDALPLCG